MTHSPLRHIVALASGIALVAAGTLVPLSANAVRQPGAAGVAQRVATEGIVMVQNDDHTLPLVPNQTVSFFGRTQIDGFPVGYGSGGDVKIEYTTNLLTAARRNPGIKVNEQLAAIYDAWCAERKPDDGNWANWPFSHQEMPLADSVVEQAAAVSDTAVVMLGRAAGESYDQRYTEGSFFLTDAEKNMLAKVNSHFDKVVVLLNIGNLIDMNWLRDYEHIKSVLFVWQGGQEYGTAIASVLSGDESPQAKCLTRLPTITTITPLPVTLVKPTRFIRKTFTWATATLRLSLKIRCFIPSVPV
ncbi:MAG: glycoside hydrolase family 3 C-terminal domain-containing protein [Bifidobacteriaceae bacterium]|jgi:hypothetical protein|nr:glycoside hydrolase family 3 C-terminal domain-containing protein [Bifidobacteriaceae bacterium]